MKTTIVLSAIASMIVGAIWYGPLFGKKWMWVIGAGEDCNSPEARKGMWKAYVIQFVLALFEVWVLSMFVEVWTDALLIWAGFVFTTLAGSGLWNGEDKKKAWVRFGIQAGYQLVIFVVFGLILMY